MCAGCASALSETISAMLTVVPTIVHVVNGTDWPAIVASISTGVAAVAGIGGTILGARMAGKSQLSSLNLSISAENERARVSEKRRIYAQCHAAFNNMVPAVVAARAYKVEGITERQISAADRVTVVAGEMYVALSELKLIAPTEVAEAAEQISGYFRAYMAATGEGAGLGEGHEYAYLRNRLYRLMREDLGESPLSGHPEEDPDPVSDSQLTA
jgi:hypothetical protein